MIIEASFPPQFVFFLLNYFDFYQYKKDKVFWFQFRKQKWSCVNCLLSWLDFLQRNLPEWNRTGLTSTFIVTLTPKALATQPGQRFTDATSARTFEAHVPFTFCFCGHRCESRLLLQVTEQILVLGHPASAGSCSLRSSKKHLLFAITYEFPQWNRLKFGRCRSIHEEWKV